MKNKQPKLRVVIKKRFYINKESFSKVIVPTEEFSNTSNQELNLTIRIDEDMNKCTNKHILNVLFRSTAIH